ncbi:MAG: esterase family protein [Firmicutes bacterium]|nr:esterase family protein [Bacillota bacterium]
MSVLQCNFFSKALNNYIDVSVYIPSYHNGDISLGNLPYEMIYSKDQKFKTLYLLHGMLDDHSSWLRWSMVEEQAEKHRIALVMPSGQNSFYVNNMDGLKYYDFINKELPMWAEMNFPLLEGRENRFIAGLSMGGYGAMRHGLANPDMYSVIGSFSGALDVYDLTRTVTSFGADAGFINYDNLFGGKETIPGSDNDLFHLLETCKEKTKELPKLYVSCGTEDVICYEMAKKFRDAAVAGGYDVQYMEMPGVHEWAVWNASVKEFIEKIA